MAKKTDQRLAQAMRALASGQIQDAEALCRAVLQDHKRDDLAMALLAQVCNQSSRYDEAIELIRTAIAKSPKRADYHGLLADMLTTRGDFRSAIRSYDKALKCNPNHPGVLSGKANTWLRLNEPEKAIKLLAPLMKGGNEDVTIATVYAKALIASGEPLEASSTLLGHLPADKEPVETRRTMYFVLGSAMEKAGEYKSAFEAYAQANELSAGGFDFEACTQLHDEIIEAFPNSSFDSMPSSGNDDDSRVFIVGMLRSGSTLTEQIIDAHPDGEGLGEVEVLPRLIRKHGGDDSISKLLAMMDKQTLRKLSDDYLAETGSNAKVVVDKQLGNYKFIGLIAALFPKAKIIHCTRNPLALGVSCFAQKLPPGTNPWASSLRGIGHYYSEYDKLMKHWKALLGDRMLQVRYEELVTDQETLTRRILDFCELDFHEKCMRFWESGRTVLTLSQDQVRKPLYDSALSRHERFGNLLDPLRDALVL